MRALTVRPGKTHSILLENVQPPPLSDGAVLVRTLPLGICDTDREIVKRVYGWAPPGSDHLIIGHESLGVVEQAPSNCDFKCGDLVVGIVRRPDPRAVCELARSANGTCAAMDVTQNAASSSATVTDRNIFVLSQIS